MERRPFNSEPTKRELELFESTFNKLNTRFVSGYIDNFEFNFKDFSLFSDYINISVGPAISVCDNKNSIVVFVQIQYHVFTGKFHYDEFEYHSWGTALLRQNFGHVIIRRETISDKIQELLHHVEINFENDKVFNNKFYVLADNNDISKSAISSEFRKALLNINSEDFLIEIINNKLIIGNKKIIDPESTLEIATFLNEISNL